MSAPSRTRSLGSSLLDQVLAETLDPSYAAAAAARPPGADAGRRGQVLVAATLVVVGLLGTVTYREAATAAPGREQVRQALIDDIDTESTTSDALVAQLDALRTQLSDARDQALAASTEGQLALDQLSVAEQGSALVAVRGPGLVITLTNAPADTDSDPVGGAGQVAAAGLVQDRDLQLVVNALWAAGAEAISINGQRLGASTAIRTAGDTVLVDFRPVTSPYEVSAIGDPGRVQQAFLASPEAAELVDVSLRYGLGFDFTRADDLRLPAGGGTELRYAEPVEPVVPSTTAPTTQPGG